MISARVEITPIEAALLQLDWAIRLLVDYSAPIPAITLAAASDESSGKCVSRLVSKKYAHVTIKEALSEKGYGTPNEIGDFMNAARNSLKHDARVDKIVLEPESEAIQLILRSVIDVHRLQGELTGEMPRFLAWVHANRPDLLTRDT